MRTVTVYNRLSCGQQKMQEKKLSPQLLLHVFVASGKVWHLDLRLSCDTPLLKTHRDSQSGAGAVPSPPAPLSLPS